MHPSSSHGTAVAGLIAGPARPGGRSTGIAPGARLVDVQVYGYSPDTGSTIRGPSTQDLAAGLRWLATRADILHVDVAVWTGLVGGAVVVAAILRPLPVGRTRS